MYMYCMPLRYNASPLDLQYTINCKETAKVPFMTKKHSRGDTFFALDSCSSGIDMISRRLKCLAIISAFVFLFCEWFIYYFVIYQCSWPKLSPEGQKYSKEPLRAILLADPHLLGSKDGHWFDQLRREWQMERAFQTAITLYKPDAVFVLGDLFDEGMKSSYKEFEYYLERFRKMFRHPEDMPFYVAVGNHDIGFHDVASADSSLFKRFSAAFQLPSAKLIQLKGNVLVIVNSIGLEGDNCSLCSDTVAEIKQIANRIDCRRPKEEDVIQEENTFRGHAKQFGKSPECEVPVDAPAPILIQHFPLYRANEAKCSGVDAPPSDKRTEVNRPKWEVVSQEASTLLLSSFKPRLVISGHTHHGCYLVHESGTPELTIPSFSWRNRNNPSFIMAVITPKNFVLSKCFMPEEYTVIGVYTISGVVLVLLNASMVVSLMKRFHMKCVRRMVRTNSLGALKRY